MKLSDRKPNKGFLLSLLFFLLFGLVRGEEFMAPDQLKPGMKGVGRTVFKGMKVEEFGVEILGVLRKWRPNGDLILAKLTGGPLEKTGVIAGMSGSPVYIQGKLIGAIAYAWPFATEPIAGITPIQEILKPPKRGVGGPLPQGSGGTSRPAPLATPVMLSGFCSQVLEEIAPFLEEHGCLPLLSEGQGRGEQATKPMPGSAIGVQLVRGDAEAIAVGTITYINGNQVYAFGHSFLNAGGVDLPFTGVYVHSILPSQVISFRFTSSAATWGKIIMDTDAGISGLIEAKARLIPLEVRVDFPGGEAENYRFEVVDHKSLTPQLIRWSSLNALLSSLGNREATLRVSSQVYLQGFPPLEREDLFTGTAPSFPLASKIADLIDKLENNEFERVQIKQVCLEVKVIEGRRSATLRGLRLNRNITTPGDRIKVTLIFQPYGGIPFEKEVEVPIPPTVPEGLLWVKAGAGECMEGWERERNPNYAIPQNFSQLLGLIRAQRGNDGVEVELVSPEPGYSVKGRELPSLPPSALAVMRSTSGEGGNGLIKGKKLFEHWLGLDYSVSGCRSLPLKVKKFLRSRR